MSLSENYKWNIANEFFKKKGFVSHQIDTFDDYIHNGIQRVVSETDVVVNISSTQRYTVSFDDVYIPNPSIIEEDRTVRPMYPPEARIRDLTYDSPIFVNVIEKTETEGCDPEINIHKRVIIGRTPIMLLSNKCNLKNLTKEERIEKGECEHDFGGYFIIKGKERVLVGQLRGVHNQPMVLLQKPNEKWKYICEVRSMSEETGHSVLIQVKIASNDRTMVFSIPYIKECIQVGILFKALGYTDEKDIYDIIGNKDKNPLIDKYIKYVIRDSFHVKTQEDALRYISQFTMHVLKDEKRIDYTTQVVENELLPHMGIFATIKEKTFFLGSMVNKLISTHIGVRKEDDRDNYSNKRVEMAGVLCCELFRTLFKKFIKSIFIQLEKKKQYPDIINIISRTSGITSGLKSSFATGNWAVLRNTYVRTGVSQVLSRLNFPANLSHLRRVVIPIGKEGKNPKIRQIHSSQIMYICNCVTGDTEVLLGDNKSVKKIKDLDEGIDEIITINPKTLEKEKSTFYNKFKVFSTENLYEISTLSDRKVKCTSEHPFLVMRNNNLEWVLAKDLTTDMFLVVKHYTKYIENDSKSKLLMFNLHKHNESKGLTVFTQTVSLRETEAIARLFGIFLSSKFKEEQNFLILNDIDDMYEVIEDIVLLGFNNPPCRISLETDEFCILVNKDLRRIIEELGLNLVDRFNTPLPKWLMESPKSVKREFLSAFQGCNGDSLKILIEYDAVFIGPTHIRISTIDESNNLKGITISNISELLKEFNITHKITVINNYEDGKKFYSIDFNNDEKNVIKYCDLIWYRYSKTKINSSVLLLEFLKTLQKRYYSYNSYKSLFHTCDFNDFVFSRIRSIKKDLPQEDVYDLTTHSKNHSFMINSIVGSNCETPEGQSIGIVMNLALSTFVTRRIPTVVVKEIIENSENIIFINDYDGENNKPKIYLNGILMGITEDAQEFINEMKDFRYKGLLDKEVSIAYDDVDNEIRIFCDEGRFIRPLITVKDDGKPNIQDFYDEHKETKILSWDEMLEKQYVTYVDNSEIQQYVVAMDNNDLLKRKNDLIEICPALMLGVMASAIPFSDHNQCILYNEPVYMADGSFKEIKDVKIGDEVITFHPKTQEQSVVKVVETFMKKTDKQMFTITTESGREITATFDHRFMTSNGWTRLEHLKEISYKYDDWSLIGISLEPIPYRSYKNNNPKLLVDYHSSNYYKEISDYLPLYDNNPKLPILSRLIGAIFNNTIYLNDEGEYCFVMNFEHENDLRDFENDIKYLDIEIQKYIFSTKKMLYYGVLPFLLKMLIFQVDDHDHNHDHNIKPKNIIPDWIINGTKHIQKEFLSSSLYIQNDCSSIDVDVAKKIEYMLKVFGINPVNLLKEKFESLQFSILMDTAMINFIKYYNIIGIRYNYNMKIEHGLQVEFLLYVKHQRDKSFIPVEFHKWKKRVIVKDNTIFIPIARIKKSLEDMICDITVDSPNQSFLCGDAFCVHNSPRNIYQSSMGKQAIGVFATSHQIRSDTIGHVLTYPQKPLVSTISSNLMGLNEMPTGINAVVAIITYTGLTSWLSPCLSKRKASQ